MSKNRKVLLCLASLWVTMVAYQGKADEPFSYDSAGPLGKIKDMDLSSDNKMFALKTTGAKIHGNEYPVWVGNTESLEAAFSSPWMTNATSSCAFFKDKLYIAPKAETNHLYCVDVGTGHIPNVKSAKVIKFDDQGNTKMNAPYLYATTNSLYAIENTNNGICVHSLTEGDQGRFSLGQSIEVKPKNGPSIRTAQIKDIVSKEIGGSDCLYILTTNGAETANLWLVNTKAATGESITPTEWKEYNEDWEFTPLFDHTTSIAVHKDKLLSANANLKHPDDEYQQLGWVFPIKEADGRLSEGGKAYRQSDLYRTSAIGSDQETYYAEDIKDTTNSMDPSLDKYFLRGEIKYAEDADWNSQSEYPNQSFSHQGAPVHKFITRKKGEIFAISPDRIYRIRDNVR